MRPDFDTVGSALALEYVLRALGKRCAVCCNDPLPKRFSIISDGFVEEPGFEPKTVVCVDMATSAMLGRFREKYESRVELSIDHHLTSAPLAKYTLCKSDAAATGELIFKLAKLLGVAMDKTLATYLYCAISSDSGCFKYSNTTVHTHRIAAELLSTGIDAAYYNRCMLDMRTPAQIALEKDAIETLRFYANGQICTMYVTREMCRRAGADTSDIDALVQLPRTVEGVEVGIVLKENLNDGYKVSVRSNDSFDATALAKLYGGGGHVRASGFVITGDDPCALADEIAKKAESML
jgi:phosphoesterase RecJ-like protein